MGNFTDHLKLKEGLSYISSNKVRIVTFRYKCNKEIIKDYLYLINNTDISKSYMNIGLTVEDIKRLDEEFRQKGIYGD